MKYRMLALDIDGTLLNSEGKLTPRTTAAVQEAVQRGIKVVLATGRRLGNSLPIAASLGLQELMVVHNGAVVFDPRTERTVYQTGLELSLAKELVDKLAASGVNYIVYTGESAGERVVAPVGSWQEPDNLLDYFLGEAAEFAAAVEINVPPVRLAVIDAAAKVDPLYAQLTQEFAGKITALYFGSNREWRGVEILPGHCNKGKGVAQAAQVLGIGPEQVVAVGDNINDLEMIAWAGLGVAMENGSPLLKDRAKKIAPSHDEDGVAAIIEELLL